MTFVLLPLLLVGCAAKKPITIEESRPRVSLFMTSNRQLELEPCGCGQNPRGGVGREHNYIQGVQFSQPAHNFIFSNGTAFVPHPMQLNRKLLKSGHYKHKARFMVRALNRLGYKAHAVSAHDLALGLKNLRQLQKKAKFEFLSSNLVDSAGKYLFSPKVAFNHQGKRIVVIALSDSRFLSQYGKKPEFRVLEVDEAIDRALQGTAADLVIALSSLRNSEVTDNLKSLRRVHLVMGAAAEERIELEQVGPRTLLINPEDRAREVAWVSFAFDRKPHLLHNSEVARMTQKRLEKLASQREKMEGAPSRVPTSTAMKQLEREASRYPKLSVKPAKNAIPFEFGQKSLGKSFRVHDRSKNPLARVVDAYKLSLKEKATQP